MNLAIGIGCCFLLGGIVMVLYCSGPLWFIASDLLLAYLPIAILGGRLAAGGNRLWTIDTVG